MSPERPGLLARRQPLLKDREPAVERSRIGVSYSAGGPMVVAELGAVLAFIEAGIVPDLVAGVSAGGFAATVHALDPRSGRAVEAAKQILLRLSTHELGLTWNQVAERILQERRGLRSLGDNEPLRRHVRWAMREVLGEDRPRIGRFQPPTHPRLLVAATDWASEDSFWFGDDELLEDALLASSAIPGVFPWRRQAAAGADAQELFLIDGGVASNQPLSRLALEGCGTIFACGFARQESTAAPGNAMQNAMHAISILQHRTSHLEEDYVRTKLRGRGEVHRIHIEVDVDPHSYDFSEAKLERLIEHAREQTLGVLREAGAGVR